MTYKAVYFSTAVSRLLDVSVYSALSHSIHTFSRERQRKQLAQWEFLDLRRTMHHWAHAQQRHVLFSSVVFRADYKIIN